MSNNPFLDDYTEQESLIELMHAINNKLSDVLLILQKQEHTDSDVDYQKRIERCARMLGTTPYIR